MGLISIMNMAFTLTLILPMMIWVSWKLTLLAFLPLPLLAVTTRSFSARIHQRSKQVQEYFGKVSSSAQEMLTGQRVTRAYVQEQAEFDKFKAVNQQYVAYNLSLIHLASIFRPLLQFFVSLSFIMVFLYGGHLVINGQLSIGKFVQQTMYLGLLIGPITAFGFVINLYQRALASMGRIDVILSTDPSIRDTERVRDGLKISGDIEFRDLTFSYRGSRSPALRNINLRILPGQTVAIVGEVGSGKSTLMQLICRLIDAESDQLLIDQRPVQEIPLQVLRSAIGYVPQETILFSETVAENVAFGKDDATPEEIEQAALEAGMVADIKEFPQGYETIIGERGVTLSGGQRQRAAIARALIRRPRILLLDDALSSVDLHTEEQILKHLRRVRHGRTSLVSSHRLSTIKDADLIVVLEAGCIVERGTHDELIARCGFYAALYQRQLLEADLMRN
jgi:ATP-binding cassette subfamily B protein